MEKYTRTCEISSASSAMSLLSCIPQVQQLMEHPDIVDLCASCRREQVVAAVREALDKVRQQIRQGHAAALPDFFGPAFIEDVRAQVERRRSPKLAPVINATGVVLHTNLGRAPLARAAVDAVNAVANGYCNLEFDLENGSRGSRYDHVEEILCRLSGAQAAVVVNNCAAAVLLALMALAKGGEVLVSRGELVEIGGSFRMPEVIAQSGARLVEVGTTNKTTLQDYERAINEHTRMILKSHPSNYRITGFTAQPERRALAQLAQQHQLIYVEDLGSGSLVDLRRYGLPYEPTVQECMRAGTHILTFSGDKLLGGPQAGVILGNRQAIERMKQHPLLRALRIDKLSLAALEATLHLYEQPAPPEHAIPTLNMLATRKEEIKRRAQSLARRLRRLPGVTCSVEDDISLPGGGSLPETGLPTCLLKMRVPHLAVDGLALRLRAQRPALIGRFVDGCFAIDLRTVTPQEAKHIPLLIQQAIT